MIKGKRYFDLFNRHDEKKESVGVDKASFSNKDFKNLFKKK